MIGSVEIRVIAANPNMPLKTMFAYVGSPSSVRIIDVPKKIGTWKIDNVYLTANYPDNTSQSVECVLVGGCYVGTLPASTEIGKSQNGFKVTADGTDENGNAVTGYVLGKGDIVILDDDAEVTPDKRTYYLHLLDELPDSPHKGDLVDDAISGWIVYDDEWKSLGVSEVEWGSIVGDLSAQNDLNEALDSKRGIYDYAVHPQAWITTGLPNGITVTSGPRWDAQWDAWFLTTSDGQNWMAQVDERAETLNWGGGSGYSPVSVIDTLAKTSQLTEFALKSDLKEALENKADKFTEWVFDGEDKSRFVGYHVERDPQSENRWYLIAPYGDVEGAAYGNAFATFLDFSNGEDILDLTASRKKVLYTGDAQEPIADLATIRNGASLGNTSLQPSDVVPATDASLTKTIATIGGKAIKAPEGGGGGGGGFDLTVVGEKIGGSGGSHAIVDGINFEGVDDGVRANDINFTSPIVFHGINQIMVYTSHDAPYAAKLNGVALQNGIHQITANSTLNVIYWYCIVSGTLITLADGSRKRIDDLTYDDILRVWDFDNGCESVAKPFWLKKAEVADFCWETVFGDGTVLQTVGPYGHRVMDIDTGRFEYVTDAVGHHVMTEHGIDRIVTTRRVVGDVTFYNLNTAYHINCYANGVLASCSLNNLYPIKDMKFVKDGRTLRKCDDYPALPDGWFEAARFAEQIGNPFNLAKYAWDRDMIKK